MKKFFLFLALTVLSCMAFAVDSTESAGSKKTEKEFIQYKPDNDMLSMNVREGSLKEQLTKISVLTGIDVRMDATLEQTITTTLEPQPVLSALEKLAKQFRLNYVIRSGKRDGKEIVTAFYLLKEGEMDGSSLEKLVSFEKEAAIRTRRKLKTPGTSAMSMALQRFEVRMSEASPAQRKHLEEVQTRMRQAMENKKKHAEQVKNEKKKRAEKREARIKEREERLEELKARDPEKYARKMQNLERAKQAGIADLKARKEKGSRADKQPSLEELGLEFSDFEE